MIAACSATATPPKSYMLDLQCCTACPGLPGVPMPRELLVAHRDGGELVVGCRIREHSSFGCFSHQSLSICWRRVSVYAAEAPARMPSTHVNTLPFLILSWSCPRGLSTPKLLHHVACTIHLEEYNLKPTLGRIWGPLREVVSCKHAWMADCRAEGPVLLEKGVEGVDVRLHCACLDRLPGLPHLVSIAILHSLYQRFLTRSSTKVLQYATSTGLNPIQSL